MPGRPPSSPQKPLPPTPLAWTDPLLVNPHAVRDKAARVNQMFASIAPSYDLNNRVHSLYMDQAWRNMAVVMAEVQPTDTVLDVACGTGDLTIKFAREIARIAPANNPGLQVTGVDFTYMMLPIARRKADRAMEKQKPSRPMKNPIFIQGDALALPVANYSVNVVSIAFGIRNVADWGLAIDEFARVLKPGGRLVILEFSLPSNAFIRGLYNFYFRNIMPKTATWISGDKTGAYKYLPESVNTFIPPDAMKARMEKAGFSEIEMHPMTFGICICYKGVMAGPSRAK